MTLFSESLHISSGNYSCTWPALSLKHPNQGLITVCPRPLPSAHRGIQATSWSRRLVSV